MTMQRTILKVPVPTGETPPKSGERPPLTLEPDPCQPRKEFSQESLLGLAQTLETGQLQPILARREGDKLIIVDGERRWRAAQLAKLPTVDVVVLEESLEAAGILLRQLITGIQKENLSPLETARAISGLMKLTGWQASRVADSIGLSAATVSRLLALLTLPESVQKRIESGDIAASTAYQIALCGTAAEQEQLAEQVASQKLSRDAVAGKLKRPKPDRDAPATPPPLRVTAPLGAGRAITISGPNLTLERLVEWLEELLAKARRMRPRGVELNTFISLLKDEAKAGGGTG